MRENVKPIICWFPAAKTGRSTAPQPCSQRQFGMARRFCARQRIFERNTFDFARLEFVNSPGLAGTKADVNLAAISSCLWPDSALK